MLAASPTAARTVPFTARLSPKGVQEVPWRPADSLSRYVGTYCDGAVTIMPEQIGFLRKKPGLVVTLNRAVEEAALRGVLTGLAEGLRIDIRPDIFAKSIHIYMGGDAFRGGNDHAQFHRIERAAQGLGLGDVTVYPHPEAPHGITSTFFSNVEYTITIVI